MIGMKVSGAKETARALGVIGSAYSRKFLLDTLAVASKPTVAEAKKNAPRQSGALRRSIRARKQKRARKLAIVKVGPGRDQFYGMFQEFGTAHHGAQPWLRPAWMRTRQAVRTGITAAFIVVLNRVASRINRKLAKGKNLSRAEFRLLGV